MQDRILVGKQTLSSVGNSICPIYRRSNPRRRISSFDSLQTACESRRSLRQTLFCMYPDRFLPRHSLGLTSARSLRHLVSYQQMPGRSLYKVSIGSGCRVGFFLLNLLFVFKKYTSWDCRAKEYIIEQTCSSGKVDAKTGSCSRRTMRLPKLFPGEAEFFVGKITPKRYCTASELACEIQRSMNPPFITEYSNTLTVNAVQVCLQVGEYSSPADLAFEIQTKVNFALNWTGTFVELSVCYEPESGRFLFSRVAPFMLEFQCTGKDDESFPIILLLTALQSVFLFR